MRLQSFAERQKFASRYGQSQELPQLRTAGEKDEGKVELRNDIESNEKATFIHNSCMAKTEHEMIIQCYKHKCVSLEFLP